VDRELILLKVKAQNVKTREKIVQIVDSTGAEIVDIGKRSVTVEDSGDEHKIKALIELLRPYGILEIARTGKIALQSEQEK
jgi:acetolactate synthase-1/3 small subunit